MMSVIQVAMHVMNNTKEADRGHLKIQCCAERL